MPVALVLTSIGFEYPHPLVKGYTPLTPRRKKVIPMDSLLLISAVVLAITSEIAKAVVILKMRNKGVIDCEPDKFR